VFITWLCACPSRNSKQVVDFLWVSGHFGCFIILRHPNSWFAVLSLLVCCCCLTTRGCSKIKFVINVGMCLKNMVCLHKLLSGAILGTDNLSSHWHVVRPCMILSSSGHQHRVMNPRFLCMNWHIPPFLPQSNYSLCCTVWDSGRDRGAVLWSFIP
jgi:hypothetical protein